MNVSGYMTINQKITDMSDNGTWLYVGGAKYNRNINLHKTLLKNALGF